ncbi:ANKRD44, partial [Symbiodinium sp. KB8]
MLVDFNNDLGRAAFVSHQWLAKEHPDPDFKQMVTLQDALKRILYNRSGCLSLDPITEAVVQTAKPLPMKVFQTETLFVWYDYFSCPQLHHPTQVSDETFKFEQNSAIHSIPAYIARCEFFLALCPVLDVEGKVLTAATWSSRGWCRLERAARELSPNSTWILIQSVTSIEAVGTILSFPSGTVGEGDFGIAEDSQKLASVMRKILMQKLNHCLRVGDLPGFRRHFNLQTVHLRGLEIEPVSGLLPSCESGDDVVAQFLHQNGLRKVGEADSAGWRPLHYAALAGNVEVLQGLLEKRADLNRRTSKDEPMLGFPPWMSALDLAVFYKHHEATCFLLSARAHPEGGVAPAVLHAANADNSEGIRLLCTAGARPLAGNLFGISSLQCAAGLAATAAVEELVLQGRPNSLDLSRALWDAAWFRGGSAELVQRLIALRADVNFQLDLPRDITVLGRLLFARKALQHRLGQERTVLTTHAYHVHGSTPLMQAIRSAQHEAAAALVAAGARLDLCNCRKWTAADFARGQSIPHFLQLGLEGDPSECGVDRLRCGVILNAETAAPILFPMYTVAADVLLKMTKVEPHEKLKAQGELIIFSRYLGRAAFVSHQWMSKHHPDPDFRQMCTLQDALRQILRGEGSLSLDLVTETMVQTAKPLHTKDFQTQAVFVWYDYFSCPQLEHRPYTVIEPDNLQQANAIHSIPAYIARCEFFIALCPVLDCPFEGKVLTAATWSRRGWCRLERAARELSPKSMWILIQSATSIEAVGTVLSFPSGTVGEGDFGIAEDRQKLASVMRKILMQKLNHCLRVGDLPGFRRHFNLQTVYLRGLDIAPVAGLLPSCEGGDDVVAEFLHQNGLRTVGSADSAGWRPLHYAALGGNVEVLRGLLEQRADVNRRTWKDEPILGFPPFLSALDLTVLFKHHEGTRLLLAARAHLEGGLAPVVQFAAIHDNAEGIRLLCTAGARPLARNLFGLSTLQCAAGLAATAAVEELVLQGRPNSLDLSRALWSATVFRGASPELVQRLIALRADIDFQTNLRRDYRPLGRLLFAGKACQHRFGRKTVLTAGAYHAHGSTPLMEAIRSAQFEAAAALIAAGARLDLRNSRSWAAADFARGQSIPRFVQLGLSGDPSECERVSSLALADGCVQ